MAGFPAPQYRAKPELKRRLIEMNGTKNGYQAWVLMLLERMPEARRTTQPWISNVLNGHKPASIWLVIALVRIAEEDFEMPRDAALALAGSWFTTENDGGEE